jgi:hypothetical protein
MARATNTTDRQNLVGDEFLLVIHVTAPSHTRAIRNQLTMMINNDDDDDDNGQHAQQKLIVTMVRTHIRCTQAEGENKKCMVVVVLFLLPAGERKKKKNRDIQTTFPNIVHFTP